MKLSRGSAYKFILNTFIIKQIKIDGDTDTPKCDSRS